VRHISISAINRLQRIGYTWQVLVSISLVTCVLSLSARAQQDSSEATPTPVQIERDISELNVSVSIFDPGIPADASTHRRLQVYPKIREIEALFLPFVLRETLLRTHEWGPVRVVPKPDVAAELLLSGTILRSDGELLELQVRAVDASGRIWIDKAYRGVDTSNTSSMEALQSGISRYQKLYDNIATDLQAARALLDVKALNDIVEISLLRYAGHLVPSVFGDYLREEPDGIYKLNRLPATGDPIIERIERIRDVEYVMTDAVDKKFKELYEDIAEVYDLWRKYRREYIQYQKDEAEHARTSTSSARPGSYEAIKKSYENFKWARLAEQEQAKWAEGFDTEVGGTVEAVEARVAELEGWVDQHYAEWDRMLSEIFLLESGAE
jgi:hypothetical protein